MLIIKPAKTLTLFIKFWSKAIPKRGNFRVPPTNTYFAGEWAILLFNKNTRCGVNKNKAFIQNTVSNSPTFVKLGVKNENQNCY